MLFDVQDQLPGQFCQLLLGKRYSRLNLELSESVHLDDVSKIPSLIQEAEDFIKSHSAQWNALCKWATEHF